MARPRGPYVRGAGVRLAAPYQRRKTLHTCPMCGLRHLRYRQPFREQFMLGDSWLEPVDPDERIEVTRMRELPRLGPA